MKSALTKKMLAMLSVVVLLAAACGTDTATDTAAAVQEEVGEVVDGVGDEDADSEGEDDMMDEEGMMDGEDMMEEVSHDLNAAPTDLGTILTDEAGLTVYLFTNDEQGAGTSNCIGDCMAMWPPVSEITSPSGALDADLVGTIERPDGSIQATYNGWPLYNFANDAAAGDTNGQGVNDIWWVLDGEGNAIT